MKDRLDKLAWSVQRPRDMHERLYHLFLTQQADLQHLYHGYKSLAALLHAGYFSIVLTANDDTMLEQALKERGLSAYQIMHIGRDPDENVAMALDGQESGICIVKFCVDDKTQLAAEVRKSLQGYLQRNIVIVGCVDGVHPDIIQALAVKKDNSIYYIVPAKPDTDIVLDVLQKRYKQYERFLIDGPDGRFVTFFDDLASLLLPPSSPPGVVLGNRHPYPLGKVAPGIPTEGKRSSSFFTKDQPEPQPRRTRPLETIAQVHMDEKTNPGSARDMPEVQWRSKSRPLEVLSQVHAEEKINPGSAGDELEGQCGRKSGPLEDQPLKSGPLEIGSPFYVQSEAIRQLPWPPDERAVLIVTVTRVELRAFLDRYPEKVRRTSGEKTYFDLGFVGQVRTIVVQANNMGPLMAHATVDEGIRTLSPRAVIMVGIAFGVREKGQQIGDILVAKQINDYDLERVGTGEDDQPFSYPRGIRVMASNWLIDRFHAGSHDWPAPPEIHFGVILSGSKLVDNKEYYSALLRSVPDAIGGEMEGTGLSFSANHHKVDWLLVKGVSDWADGTKGVNKVAYQQLAAENAARFVLFVIQQEDFMHKV